MTTSDQQGSVQAGWYQHPQTGQPAWWTGAAWSAAPPPAPIATPTPTPLAVPAVTAQAWSPPAAAGGAGMNQFGYPASGSPGYASPGRYAGAPHRPNSSGRGGGGGTNLVTWLVVGAVAIVLVVGGLLVFRGLGKTAQAGAQVGQQGITGAHDADVKQALLSSANTMETWFTEHQNYAIKGPVAGLSATTHVQVWSTDTGYCLRGYSLTGVAQGPTNGTYWWYDSQGGGLQSQPGAAPANTVPGAVCPHATTFTKLN